jgi:glycosyltransferase involved in cell wall biosynthesis
MSLKVLIAFKGTIEKAPRPYRFLSYCQKHKYDITIACSPSKSEILKSVFSFSEISNIEKRRFFRVGLKLLRTLVPIAIVKEKINQTLFNYGSLKKLLEKEDFDLIYIADIYLLSIINKYKKAAKLLFDAREYYPLQYGDNLNFRLFEKPECIRILKKNLIKCDKVITVSPGLAEAYNKNFNVLAEVVLSVPEYQNEKITNESDDIIKILYHGMANRNRKIENFITIIDNLKLNAELHLYMVGDESYIYELKTLASGNNNIFFHEPVAFKDIIHSVNQFDIGICFYEPTSFNVKHCLPNKFFEYIQARLVVAIGPSPDMASIVREFNCGIISDNFTVESMAESINTLTRKDITQLKMNSDKAARYFCFEKEDVKFSGIISTFFSS